MATSPDSSPPPGRAPSASGLLLAVLRVAGALLAGRALFLALTNRVALAVVLGAPFRLYLLGLGVSLGLCLWVLVREQRGNPAEPGPRLRSGVATLVLGWLLFAALVDPFQRLWFDLAAGAVAGAWALVSLVPEARGGGWRRVRRSIALAAFGTGVAVLGLELGLRAWASLWPSALNARVGAGPAELIRRFRCDPGHEHIGFACNSRGFYDTEFYRKSAGDTRPLVVAIGDSFNVGAVPHAWHFTTICEELTGARLYNMGVAGIGPAEYLRLLVDEALPLEPDLVLLDIFIGNDLDVVDTLRDQPDAGLRSWFQRDQLLLFVVPERLARVAAERERLDRPGRGVAQVQGERAEVPERALERDEAALAFPWVTDPAREEPSLSLEAFQELETQRALTLCAQVPPSFDLLCETILAARRAAGDVPLRVVLIPDEFQVEDGLWETIRAQTGLELERDLPQRLIKDWLAEQGIPCLDLLPALREVPPGPDGRRHLYHLQDTHFNARGNEVVARALADFLR